MFVPLNDDGTGDPVKVCRLRLRNDSSRRRRVTVLYFAEWVLGTNREDQQPHIQTIYDQESGALFARQSWNGVSPTKWHLRPLVPARRHIPAIARRSWDATVRRPGPLRWNGCISTTARARA